MTQFENPFQEQLIVLKQLIEIETRFDLNIRKSNLNVSTSDLEAPSEELKGGRQSNAAKWDSIRQRYLYAIKHDIDRLPSIIADLTLFIKTVPIVLSLQRCLAYFQYQAGKRQYAITTYKEVALYSHNVDDWLDMAAIAFEIGDEALACYGLTQCFRQENTIATDNEAWYIYVGLVQKTGDYALLGHLLSLALSPAEDYTLLETGIYLLKRVGEESLAQGMLRQLLRGHPVEEITQNIFNYLPKQLSKAYLQVETEANTLRAQLLHKMAAGTPSLSVMPVANAGNGPRSSLTTSELSEVSLSETATSPTKSSSFEAVLLAGEIFTYKATHNYGFLYGQDGSVYFFHRKAIDNSAFLEQLERTDEKVLDEEKRIPVYFEIGHGPKGLIATHVWSKNNSFATTTRTTIGTDKKENVNQQPNEVQMANKVFQSSNDKSGIAPTQTTKVQMVDNIFELAQQYAHEEKYPLAIKQIKRVLALDPNYPGAQQAHEQWRERARLALIPKGSNPYAQAKRALSADRDLDSAVDRFNAAINQNDHKESAVKDLASLYLRLNRSREAIELLLKYRQQMSDQQSIDNLLIQAYQKVEEYDKAIELLKRKIESATSKDSIVHHSWIIATNYMRLEDYPDAHDWFERIYKQGTGTRKTAAQINIALCLLRQRKYDQAEQLLIGVLKLDTPANVQEQVDKLLNQVRISRHTGQLIQLDEMVTETSLADFSSGINSFTRFFMERCAYEGVPPQRVQDKNFERGDIRRLEDLAAQLGPRRPRERAGYYLSAAMIISTLEDLEDQNLLYRYLCRSFTSRGDALVLNSGQLDAIREWYCEALRIYDGDHGRGREDQDAICALIRFLYGTIGLKLIPIRDIPTIEDALRELLDLHPSTEQAFDAITYLTSSSRFAANRIWSRLYKSPSLRALALNYLKSKGCVVPSRDVGSQEFSDLWKEHVKRSHEVMRSMLAELRAIAKVEITPASLERSLGFIRNKHFFFELDQQRLNQLQRILETALDACQQRVFDEWERYCLRIDGLCQELLQEIESSPTRISVEVLYPIVESVQRKIHSYLEEIYKLSVPQLTIRPAFDSYTPDDGQCIEVQIVIANAIGCSPAESLELVHQDDEAFFTLAPDSEVELRESLRGGDQRILKLRLLLTKHAIEQQAFSLTIYSFYRTRLSEKFEIVSASLPISLYSKETFTLIANPYARYALGSIVSDPQMFYGRDHLITHVVDVISNARTQSKSVVIFGQKRSGKSSILYYLSKKLRQAPDILVVDVGNVGAFLGDHEESLLHQLLYSILHRLQYVIEDAIDGRQTLHFDIPSGIDFFSHPAPLLFFKNIFEQFQRETARTEGWHHTRVVVLIDEFSYIYGEIQRGKLSPNFMKNWKALLEANLFNVVFVGQDVMPKFKRHFPNEFGIIEDVRVSYLDDDDARRLIDEPIQIGGRQGQTRYREQAIRRILDLTAGSPFYIQIICNRLVNYMNNKRIAFVTEADVNQVKDSLIRGNNCLGWDNFDNLINSGDISPDAISDEDIKKVLSAIASNGRTSPCSRSSILCETETPIDIILDDLEERQVIERIEGQYYTINVGLFKEWLLVRQ